MSELAAISGQLVDVRNVGTHKCVKLTIHVPAEYAPRVFAAFGWPTGVDPVPVALARMKPESEVMPNNGTTGIATQRPTTHSSGDKTSPASEALPAPTRARKPVAADKRLAQQAGICCTDPIFHAYLFEHDMAPERTEKSAAIAVRMICGVQSRVDIIPRTPAGDAWEGLYSKFIAWKLAA